MSTDKSQTQRAKWQNVEDVLQRHHHKPDIEAARCLYSAFAAHGLGGPPVWAMLVAPPGCMKTELLSSLEGLPGVLLLDKLTTNTFISGQLDDPKREKKAAASLLHRIGADAILIYPDFSTVLAMNRDHRATVLADLRRIYDGHLRREFGTSENLSEREWRGRLTLLVAATPDVDRYYSVFQTLGERFVMIRWHRPDGLPAALKAMNQDGPAAKNELRDAVHSLFANVTQDQPSLDTAFQERIAALSEFVVRARTHVHRESYGRKEITYAPEPEAPTRLAQQLAQLAKGSARLSGRAAITNDDFAIVQRCALDCIPAARRAVLDTLVFGGSGPTKIPRNTLWYARQELEVLELVEGESSQLSKLARDLVIQAGILAVHDPSPPPEVDGLHHTHILNSISVGGDTL